MKTKSIFLFAFLPFLALSFTAPYRFLQDQAATTKEYPAGKGDTYVVTESHPIGASFSDVVVALKGYPGQSVKLTSIEPVGSVLVADLDKNGFNELYILSVSAGSGSYGTLNALTVTALHEIITIAFPELKEKDMAKGGRFEGYMGHDKFEVKGDVLTRTWPLNGKGPGTRTLTYQLVAGKAGYSLQLKP